jgi:hypothetical protein
VQAQTRYGRTDHARRAAVARRDGALVLALMRHIARGAEYQLWSVADLRSHRACVAGGARADRTHARPWCKRQLFSRSRTQAWIAARDIHGPKVVRCHSTEYECMILQRLCLEVPLIS